MSLWKNRPTDWEINALVIISAQLKDIQRKLDALLNASSNIPKKQLQALEEASKALEAKTDSLAKSIEENK